MNCLKMNNPSRTPIGRIKTNPPDAQQPSIEQNGQIARKASPNRIKIVLPGPVHFGSGFRPSAMQVREEAQAYFFAVLRQVCPELLYSLRSDLLPLYVDAAERHSKSGTTRAPAVLGSFLELERLEPVVAEAVRNWCDKHRLIGEMDPEPEWHGPDWALPARMNSLWPAVRVHETLLAWSRDLGSHWRDAEPPQWAQTTAFRGRSGTPRTLRIPVPDLDDFDNEAQFIRHASKIAQHYLQDELARQKRREDPDRSSSQVLKTRPDHFVWLALKHVKGLSARAIADWHRAQQSEGIEVNAVRMGVKAAAGLIALQLRIGPLGGPWKK
jgi:hypothetical protein